MKLDTNIDASLAFLQKDWAHKNILSQFACAASPVEIHWKKKKKTRTNASVLARLSFTHFFSTHIVRNRRYVLKTRTHTWGTRVHLLRISARAILARIVMNAQRDHMNMHGCVWMRVFITVLAQNAFVGAANRNGRVNIYITETIYKSPALIEQILPAVYVRGRGQGCICHANSIIKCE